MAKENKVRILVVENEPLIAKDIRLNLEKMGYLVQDVVSTYHDALANVEDQRPDLALMDINLDGNKDGIDTAMALHKQFNIPVVFLTSLRDMDIIQRAKKSEPFGYLLKPFRPDDLQTTIEMALFNAEKSRNLSASVNKLSQAMKVVETAIFITDPHGKIDYYNPYAEELTQWKEQEKKGGNLNDVLTIKGQPALDYLMGFSDKERLQENFDFVENSALHNRTGKSMPVRGSIGSFHSPEGKIAGYITVLTIIKPGERTSAEAGATAPEQIIGQVVGDYFFLKDKSSLFRIRIDSISYIEALGNYVRIHTDKKTFTGLMTMKEIERMLPEGKFFKVHRSYIVALDRITAIHSSDVQLGETTVPIGKTFKEDLLKRIHII